MQDGLRSSGGQAISGGRIRLMQALTVELGCWYNYIPCLDYWALKPLVWNEYAVPQRLPKLEATTDVRF